MSRSRRGSIFLLLIVIASIAGLLFVCSPAVAEECRATVSIESSTVVVHVPAVSVGGSLYSLDLIYTPSDDGKIWFDVTGILAADGVQCENPASVPDFSGTFFLVLPSVEIGANTYEAAFKLVVVPDNTASDTKTMQTVTRIKAQNIQLRKKAAPKPPITTAQLPNELRIEATVKAFLGNPDTCDMDFYFKGKVRLGPYTSDDTGYTYGAASGTLELINASCKYNVPDVTCIVKSVGSGANPLSSGWITVNSIHIKPDGDVSLSYNIGFPDSSISTYVCYRGECLDGTWGDNLTFVYKKLHDWEVEGGAIEAIVFDHFITFWKDYRGLSASEPYAKFTGSGRLELVTDLPPDLNFDGLE